MPNEIVNLLIEYELSISRLYATCSRHFPKIKAFWMELSAEEIIHAETIKELLREVDEKNLKLNQKRFNVRPLEISMAYANEVKERVKNNDLDLIGILSLALDIETSVIESKFYEIFTGISMELNIRLKKVRDESIKHARQIREMKQKVMMS